jgi:hypothetical protein
MFIESFHDLGLINIFLMKKQSVKLMQSESHLPSLKIKTSPKSIFNNSPSGDLNQVRRNIDRGFPDASSPNQTRSINLNLNKKVSNLLKIIQEQDMKIKSIESELNLTSPSYLKRTLSQKRPESNILDSNSFIEHETSQEMFLCFEDNKNFTNLLPDFTAGSKIKDLEILKLKKQIKEEENQIIKLYSENVLTSEELSNLELISNKWKISGETIQELKSQSKEKVMIIEQEIEVVEKKIQSKRKEIEEFAELLKKSEEKRTYSNEYNIFMENNEQKLKEKLNTLQKEKEKIVNEIIEVKAKIMQQEQIIQKITQNLEKIDQDLKIEKKKSENLSFKYETAKDSLQESRKQNELQTVQFQADLETFQQKENPISEKTEKTPKKPWNINDSLFLLNISKEETLKLQQKFNKLEKELIYAQEALERLKKNEIYLQSQFSSKELMISQIEKLLKTTEIPQQSKKKEDDKKPETKKIKDLQNLVRAMKENYSNLDLVKCIKCLKFASNSEFLLPCGHLICTGCLDVEVSSCVFCGSWITGLLKSPTLIKTISHLNSYQDKLSKANKLLMQH